jgi:leucyl-tRNA synthetase
LVEEEVTVAIQVNGKMRGTITVDYDASEAVVMEHALAVEAVVRQLEDKEIQKVIFVPNKIINLIVA